LRPGWHIVEKVILYWPAYRFLYFYLPFVFQSLPAEAWGEWGRGAASPGVRGEPSVVSHSPVRHRRTCSHKQKHGKYAWPIYHSKHFTERAEH